KHGNEKTDLDRRNLQCGDDPRESRGDARNPQNAHEGDAKDDVEVGITKKRGRGIRLRATQMHQSFRIKSCSISNSNKPHFHSIGPFSSYSGSGFKYLFEVFKLTIRTPHP